MLGILEAFRIQFQPYSCCTRVGSAFLACWMGSWTFRLAYRFG